MTTGKNKTKERRRFKRYGINLDAILVFEESITLQCHILDFCQQGLFLEIKRPGPDLFQILHKKGKVLFFVTTGQGREYVHIDVTIMRVCSNGVGVAFEKISEEIFQGLLKKAKSQAVSKSADAHSSNREVLKSALQDLVNDQLTSLMGHFINRVFEYLEQAAMKAHNLDTGEPFLEASRTMALLQETVIKDFCRSISNNIDFIVAANPASDGPNSGNGQTLSLVDINDFEEWLRVSSSVKKVESNFSEQLNQMELKLSFITGINRNELVNPLSPAKLFDGLKDAIGKVDEFNKLKQSLYKVFEGTLIDLLSPVYQALEKILQECGAPKQISGESVLQDFEPAKRSPDISPEPYLGNYPERTADFRSSTDIPRQSLPASAESAFVPPQTVRTKQGQPVAETATNLLNIINQSELLPLHGNVPEKDLLGTDGVSESSAYSADEIVAAISNIQTKEAANSGIHHDYAAMHKHLVETLEASTGGVKQFSAVDKNRIEVYGQLFDTLMNDLMYTPHIKSYLETIHLPLMALALKDPGFLDSETHPARSVLNQLSSLETAVKGNRIVRNQKIRDKLDDLFERIAHEGMDNPLVFAAVDEELKDLSRPLLKSTETSIRRIIEAYEGKQKLEEARTLIQNEIDARIAGKTVPEVIPTLLDSGWQHLMVIIELNDENNTNARHSYLNVIDNLLNWFSNSEPFSEALLIEIQRELTFIENELSSVCANAFLHDKVIDELRNALLGTGNPPVRKPVSRVHIEPGKPETDSSATIDNNWTRQVDRFQVGEWFTLSLEAEEFEPLKLVWIGKKRQIYVFVSRDGQKKLEFSRKDLAALMRSGSVTKIESLDEPLMERAANQMLQKMYEKLVFDASHDPITNSINKREFLKQLKEILAASDESRHMLCFLEILDFRTITNICGLLAGDELLRNISQVMKSHFDQDIIFARLGDNALGLLIKDCQETDGMTIAKKLSNKINKSHFEWDNKSYSIGVGIGLVPFFNYGFNADELLKQADSACISAKTSNQNHIRLYREDDVSIRAQTHLHDWIGRIDQILAENRLFVRCQKIEPIDRIKNHHSHYEILLGLKDDSGKQVSPGDFIPAVEYCRRMPEIDNWVIQSVFAWIENNKSFFEGIGGFAINLSGQSLNSEEFLENLLLRLKTSEIPMHKITFEVTETVASDNLIFTETFISQIKQFGCKFSLDDFGTGYSSYSYLKKLDVDYLKIDGSFIKEIAVNPTDVAMVKSINEIAHSLGLETIAEYVENDEIYAVLREIGVDFGQGWVIHKPVPLAELENKKTEMLF